MGRHSGWKTNGSTDWHKVDLKMHPNTRAGSHLLPSHVINAPCVLLSPSALRCHALWRWGSLSVLIRIHGCQDLSPGQFSLLCSSASLTGYWSGPISSLLRRPTCPELLQALKSLIFMKSQGHHQDILLTLHLAPALLYDVFVDCEWLFVSSRWPVSESVLTFCLFSIVLINFSASCYANPWTHIAQSLCYCCCCNDRRACTLCTCMCVFIVVFAQFF